MILVDDACLFDFVVRMLKHRCAVDNQKAAIRAGLLECSARIQAFCEVHCRRHHCFHPILASTAASAGLDGAGDIRVC